MTHPHRMRTARAAAVVATVGVAVAACGGGGGEREPRTIVVAVDGPTLDEALAQARPGDVVEIEAGTYAVAVTVTTDDITIRGVDRNAVVLDGGDELATAITVAADGVAVENLTVRRYQQNGVLVAAVGGDDGYGGDGDGVDGYRVSYVTAVNNGLYGIYAFGARNGLIEHSYASGHPDSGFYVGQCKPCDVVLRDVVAERNAIGYYGTNASGGVVVVDSVFRRNRLGLTPNSQRVELLAPQAETVIAGNLVVDNDDPSAPPIPMGFFGGGISVGGGTRNLVVRNRVEGHDVSGISVIDLNEFLPTGNVVEGNVLADNGVDLWFGPAGVATTLGNCFGGNTFTSSSPADIEAVMPCPGADVPVDVTPYRQGEAPPAVDYRTIPLPPTQPTMPASARSSTGGAGPQPPTIDLDAVVVPDG